eukprot:scaffold136202_cov18-Prasinocladus_malaysianus.AAC.1
MSAALHKTLFIRTYLRKSEYIENNPRNPQTSSDFALHAPLVPAGSAGKEHVYDPGGRGDRFPAEPYDPTCARTCKTPGLRCYADKTYTSNVWRALKNSSFTLRKVGRLCAFIPKLIPKHYSKALSIKVFKQTNL